MKRRSWQIELPHMGDLPAGTQRLRKASSSTSACASVRVEALTLSIRPERPWVPLFQLSMPSSTASSWWITSTGPSARMLSSESVTTIAISMMRSVSGIRPVISMSSQIRLFSLLTDLTPLGTWVFWLVIWTAIEREAKGGAPEPRIRNTGLRARTTYNSRISAAAAGSNAPGNPLRRSGRHRARQGFPRQGPARCSRFCS